MLPESDDIQSLHTARVEAAIALWLEAAEQGKAPEPEEFIARHSEFAAELLDFFADHAIIAMRICCRSTIRDALRAFAGKREKG
jgi:hypothetical protein